MRIVVFVQSAPPNSLRGCLSSMTIPYPYLLGLAHRDIEEATGTHMRRQAARGLFCMIPHLPPPTTTTPMATTAQLALHIRIHTSLRVLRCRIGTTGTSSLWMRMRSWLRSRATAPDLDLDSDLGLGRGRSSQGSISPPPPPPRPTHPPTQLVPFYDPAPLPPPKTAPERRCSLPVVYSQATAHIRSHIRVWA